MFLLSNQVKITIFTNNYIDQEETYTSKKYKKGKKKIFHDCFKCISSNLCLHIIRTCFITLLLKIM